MTRTSVKTAKDFIEMKKQETPVQPKVVPDAVADFFLRPFKIAASLFPYALKNTFFRRPHGSALFRFPYAQSANFPRPFKTAASPNRRPSNPISRRIKSGATSNDSRPPPEYIKTAPSEITAPTTTAKASKRR